MSRILLLAGAGLCLLAACRSNPPAPVTEAGQALVITPPVVVASSRRPVEDVSSDSSRRSSPPETRPAPPSGAVHRVQRGDTLFSIAYQYDLDYRSLAIANQLTPPYTIFIDQELNLDVEQIRDTGSRSPNLSVGTPVSDNAVARSRGIPNRNGGVIRQPIDTVQTAPDWAWPLRGQVLRGFNESGSEGLDIAGMRGAAVHAAGAGDVVYAGNGIQGAGNLIIVRHNDRYLSAYGHNSRLLVEVGDRVSRGEQIAEMGQNAAGVAMLHFEIRAEGKSVDPLALLPAR